MRNRFAASTAITCCLVTACASAQITVRTEQAGSLPGNRRPTPDARRKGPLAPDRVGGRVLSAADGHPIPNAFVDLQDPRSGQVFATTQADAEGRYRFEPQPVGKYSLRATAPGYLAAAYQEHDGFSTAIVLGAGLATDALTLELRPSAVIAGRVLDEAGDPVQHGQVTLYRENPGTAPEAEESDDSNRIQRTRSAQTDDDGSFEFAGVAPGRFYLSANAQPWYATHPRTEPENASQPYRSSIDPALDVAYPELFYPGSIDQAGAAPIPVKGGEQIAANFVMQPQRSVTLTLRLGPDGPNRGVPQLMRTVFGITEPVQTQFSGGNGQTMSISGIPPGRYSLQTFSPNGRLPRNGGMVDLTGGSTTVDMPTASAGNSAGVHITLHAANGTSLPDNIQFNLRPDRNLQRGGMINERVSDKNEVSLPAVPADDYRFALFSGGHALTITGLSVNGKTVPDRRLHVTGSGEIQADLNVTPYAPSLEGFAQHDGKGVPGSMIVLVPAGADTGTNLFRRDQSDLDGSFTMNDVVPGNYLLVAIEDGWKLPRWNDAAALAPYLTHATPVTVANSGGGTIHLPESVTSQPVEVCLYEESYRPEDALFAAGVEKPAVSLRAGWSLRANSRFLHYATMSCRFGRNDTSSVMRTNSIITL